MPLGYKYVERTADAQINWAEVGREASGMLLEVNRVREEKKEAYNQATREEMNNLMNTPQGENQDANGFINNYAHDMIEQMKIDEDLFKRGMLKERDYTLKRQNNMDGTKSLFEIQKLYQTKYKEKMDGVMSGKLQSMNIFNMGMVEGYGDFNNSKATVNPVDGTVGIGLMENKIIDGKSVRVLSKNIAPVNVIRGKIMHDVPTFDVGKATTDTVANFGSRKDILYKAAKFSGAGTITELMGPDFLAVKKDPTTQKIVNDMNDAINDKVSSFFSNPYNLSSVMTENLGKYNAQSFTFDKDESDKDPNKILVKVDPNTQMTTLDNTGKNYEAQKKEASDWVRRDILSKMDQERGIKTTAQNELQERRAKTPDENSQKNMEQDAKNFAVNTSNFLYGTDAQKASSITYFVGMGADIKVNPTGKPKGNYIFNPDTSKYVLLQTEKGDTTAGGRAAIGGLLKATGQNFPQDLVFKNMKIGKTFNSTYSGTGTAAERPVKKEFEASFNNQFSSDLFKDSESKGITSTISQKLSKMPSVQIEDTGGAFSNTIKITVGKKWITVDSRSKKLAMNQKTRLRNFLIENVPESELEDFLGPEAGTTGGGELDD